MRLRTSRKVKESRSRSSRIIDIIWYINYLNNIIALLYYSIMIMVPPYAIHLRYNNLSPEILTMGEWPYLRTHVCYRQKWGTKRSARQWSFRQYVIRPSNSTKATIRMKGGYFPCTVGYFPTKKTETIDLETVVRAIQVSSISYFTTY